MSAVIKYDLSMFPADRRLELELRILEIQARQREAFWIMVQGIATLALLFGITRRP